MTAGTGSSVRMATVSVPGPASASNACSPAGPPPWVSSATAVRPRTAHTADFSARAASQRPAAAAASKPRSSGCRSKVISSPTATGSISPLPCPICCGPSLTTTGLCSMPCSVQPPGPCSAGPSNRAWRWAFSARYTPTVASSISIPIFTCPSPAADLISGMTSGGSSFLRSTPWKKSGAELSSGC